MLTSSSLILILFILPEVKDSSNLKPCDILNSVISSRPGILDSICQIGDIFCLVHDI